MATCKTRFALEASIRELCRTHPWAISGSLTFQRDVTDLGEAQACLRKVLERVRRRHPDIKLVGVWERQKRGVWHSHWVASSFVDVNWLRSIAVACGFGPQMLLQQINPVPGFRAAGVEPTVRYLCKYLSKDIVADTPKGARLVWFHGVGSRKATVRFSWGQGMARLYRLGRSIYKEVFGVMDWDAQRADAGIIVRMGWDMLSPDEQAAALEHSDCVRRWWFGDQYLDFVPF